MTDQFTRSKIPIKPVYTPEDTASLDYENKLGAPGKYPYTRGIRPAGAWTWIQRELSGEGDPQTSNKQLKHLIARGQAGIDVIWFGILIILAWQIGMVIPPVGMMAFVAQNIVKEPTIGTVYKGCLPFAAVLILIEILVILFPQIALFLPSMMGIH